jgi:hypothetical protein
MATVFATKNPHGVQVLLYEETWERHIKPGHAEVTPFAEQIKETIRQPNVIYEHAGSHLYFRLGAVNEPRFRELYLQVVVREAGVPPKGVVVTAFFTRTLPEKGKLLWIQKS